MIDAILRALATSLEQTHATATAMPSGFYTDPEFLKHEHQHLFEKEWICIGRANEAPSPGDYWTVDLLGEPLVVVRGDDGQLRVLANVCRHRGMPLMTGRGHQHQLMCPYHNWSYDLQGQLQRAPLFEPRADFNQQECRLPEVNSTVWQGFLFVNFDSDATPLQPRLVDLDQWVDNYHMAQMHPHFSQVEQWPTNWKCLTENFMEGYHLSTVHYETLHTITPSRLCERFPAGDGYFGYLSHYPPELPRRGAHHPDVSDSELRRAVMFAVPPGLVVALGGHKVSYICMQPQGVDSVSAKLGVDCYPSNAGNKQQSDPAELFRTVVAQDKEQLVRLQRGLKSRFYSAGPLATENLEGNVLDFYQYMARRLAHEASLTAT